MQTLRIWFDAARPKTLAAALIPVLIGASLAWAHQSFNLVVTFVALFCALAIQIGTNFANDYFDFVKGSDTDERIGFTRATSAGLVSPRDMLTATLLAMGIAFFTGLYLVWIGGIIILLIGVFSILFGVLYTGGPFPLGYNGLGDLFVFIFFGVIAVTGTYYVNTLSWSGDALWLSVPVGCLCVNILAVNNLRDVHQDKKAGKRTIGVIFGEKALVTEYLLMLAAAFAVPVIMYTAHDYSVAILAPLAALPSAFLLQRRVRVDTEKSTLNRTLEQTAKFMVLFGLLLSAGILFQPA